MNKKYESKKRDVESILSLYTSQDLYDAARKGDYRQAEKILMILKQKK